MLYKLVHSIKGFVADLTDVFLFISIYLLRLIGIYGFPVNNSMFFQFLHGIELLATC